MRRAQQRLALSQNVTQQIGDFHMKRLGQMHHDCKSGHLLATLDKADVTHVHISEFRELFLGQSAFSAPPTDRLAENFGVATSPFFS
jgi:TorA maturation chaperone TorD